MQPLATAYFDPPIILDASVTPIPGSGSSPLQVSANLGNLTILAIDYIDSTGDYIGVYFGPSGFEVFCCIIGGGLNLQARTIIPLNSRISLRSMTAAPITNGKITCTFLSNGTYFGN